MSRTIVLYWAYAITEAEFLTYMSSLGGTVIDQEQLDLRVSEGSCHVWIYNVRGALAGRFETPSESVRVHLGASPRVSISLNLSSNPDSAMLALTITRELLKQWPGVAEGALHAALSLHDAEHRLSAVLGGCVCIALASEPPLAEALAECEGFAADASDAEMIQSLATELQSVRDLRGRSYFDPARDKVFGVIPMGAKHSWVLQAPATPWLASSDPADRKLTEAARGILGQQPSSLVRLVLGETGEEGEAERQSIRLFRALSRTQPASMVGLFSLFLDHDHVAKMLEMGDVDLR